MATSLKYKYLILEEREKLLKFRNLRKPNRLRKFMNLTRLTKNSPKVLFSVNNSGGDGNKAGGGAWKLVKGRRQLLVT